MKKCLKCDSTIEKSILIDGKRRNLQNRKYCLECSPFGLHNTLKIDQYNISKCITCDANLNNNKIKFCSNKCKQKSYYDNNSDKSKIKNYNKRTIGQKRKYYFITLKGGGCEVCGYKKNMTALEFHHINPKDKKFEVNLNSLSSRNLDVLLLELNKCKLLCSNCHREHHNASLDMSYFAGIDGLEPPTFPSV